MRLPAIRGVIDRRILINYRVAPDVLAELLPAPFRPQRVKGWGMAGICLIRLREIRPSFLPRAAGLSSENAAHRIAVEWDDRGQTRQGVYVPRRDTSSRINTALAGRIFTSPQHHAIFSVDEREGRLDVTLDSDDGATHVRVREKRRSRWARARSSTRSRRRRRSSNAAR